MVIYFSFVIPVIITIILLVFFKHKTQWWEVGILMGFSVLFVLFCKWICVSSLTSDTEWLGGYVTDVRYYEPWDEEVPCRHEIPCSHVKTCTDDNGKSYDCGYEHSNDGYYHAYDVDYHSEYWEAVTTLGDYGISESRYEQLVKQFGTGKHFVDMNRDFHSIDGDQYRCDWGGQDGTLEPVAKPHTYENRPMVSNSIYKYDEVDTFDIKEYKPFEYPEITNLWRQDVLLGINNPKLEQRLQVLNSRLGKSKQIRIFLLVFRNQTREAGFVQERYWQGGNKNELIVCVNLYQANKVTWGHVISWTDETAVKVKIKHKIEDNKDVTLDQIVDTVEESINTDWVRKPFHDFDYLNIEPTTTQVVWTLLLTLFVDVGIAVWIIMNEHEVNEHGRSSTRW
jgi:hypothetical protein